MKYMKYTILAIALLTTLACKDEDPKPENPAELITTLRIDFLPLGLADPAVFEFRDTDGDGGNPPVITADTLDAYFKYEATLTLLNESVSPVEDMTSEILAEAVDHQFFFMSGGVTMIHAYNDNDVNGNPVGILNKFSTGDPGSGTLKVILRHRPDKGAPGVSNGVITQAGGETDLEVVFPLIIQ